MMHKDYFLKKLDSVRKKVGNRTGPNVIWLKEDEDDTKLRVLDRGWSKPTLPLALCDFECGIVCIAGRPNMGKSTLLVNMMMGALANQDDIIVVDLSFDDSWIKRYQQYIACLTGLTYQQIVTSDRSAADAERIEEAHQKLTSYVEAGRLEMYEGSETYVNEIGNTVTSNLRKFDAIITKVAQLRTNNPTSRIVMFVDAWNNLDTLGGKGVSGLEYVNAKLGELQAMANEMNVMVIFSAHLRKGDSSVLSIDDMKGSSDLGYSAQWTCIVRNLYREGRDNPPMKTLSYGVYPIIALEVVKTKVSERDDVLLYTLASNRCQLNYVGKEEYHVMLNEYITCRDKDTGGKKK